MNCDEEALSEYLDGELPPVRRAAVEAHLASCPACRGMLERLKAGSAAFRAHGGVKAPDGLAREALGHPARETAGREARWVPAAVLASLFLVMFLSGKVLKPQISGIFNQCMGMISGAASTVGSGDGGGAGGDAGGLLLVILGTGFLAVCVLGWLVARRRR